MRYCQGAKRKTQVSHWHHGETPSIAETWNTTWCAFRCGYVRRHKAHDLLLVEESQKPIQHVVLLLAFNKCGSWPSIASTSGVSGSPSSRVLARRAFLASTTGSFSSIPSPQGPCWSFPWIDVISTRFSICSL